VYYYKPTADVTVTASLCGSITLPATFDARLYMLADVDSGGTLRAAACSNNACGSLPSLTVGLRRRALQDACLSGHAGGWFLLCMPSWPSSFPVQASLQAGVGYAFVVDGVAGASGSYSIRQGLALACTLLPVLRVTPFPLCWPVQHHLQRRQPGEGRASTSQAAECVCHSGRSGARLLCGHPK
jgi:hypothetical protein